MKKIELWQSEVFESRILNAPVYGKKEADLNVSYKKIGLLVLFCYFFPPKSSRNMAGEIIVQVQNVLPGCLCRNFQ